MKGFKAVKKVLLIILSVIALVGCYDKGTTSNQITTTQGRTTVITSKQLTKKTIEMNDLQAVEYQNEKGIHNWKSLNVSKNTWNNKIELTTYYFKTLTDNDNYTNFIKDRSEYKYLVEEYETNCQIGNFVYISRGEEFTISYVKNLILTVYSNKDSIDHFVIDFDFVTYEYSEGQGLVSNEFHKTEVVYNSLSTVVNLYYKDNMNGLISK